TAAGDTNWMCVAINGGTSTRTSTGVAASTSYVTLRIFSTSAGVLSCSVNGGSTTTVSTNLPTAATFGLILQPYVRTLTIATKTLDLDWIAMKYPSSR